MKLVIASDIHGAARWCGELLGVVERERPDTLVLLGDLLYHGPRNNLPDDYAPKEVIAQLNGIGTPIVAVRGNCEAEVDQTMLGFPCMADYALIQDAGRQIFCTHGHVFSPESLPQLAPGSLFLSGHTHVKRNEVVSGIRVFNPGSVGLPKDGTHSCGLYDDGALSFVELGAATGA